MYYIYVMRKYQAELRGEEPPKTLLDTMLDSTP